MLNDLVEEFLTDCIAGGLSPKTIAVYRYNLTAMARFLDQSPPSVRSVRAFMAHLQTLNGRLRPLSPHTVDQYYRTLNTFFVWCEREKADVTNPMPRIRRPRLPKKLVARLTAAQVRELIAAVKATAFPYRNLAIVLLMLDAGPRLSEVASLSTADLNLDEGIAKVRGKGNKEREVPLGRHTVQALRDYLQTRQPSHPHLFLSRQGKPLTASAITSIFKRLRKRLGWQKLYPHLLRHSFAKLYLEEGNLRNLQAILGHASVSTTADIYLDPDIDDLVHSHRRCSPIDRIMQPPNRLAS